MSLCIARIYNYSVACWTQGILFYSYLLFSSFLSVYFIIFWFSPRRENEVMDDDELSLKSYGETLRLQTRNYPQELSTDRPGHNVNVDMTSQILQIYRKVGKTLISPQVNKLCFNLSCGLTKTSLSRLWSVAVSLSIDSLTAWSYITLYQIPYNTAQSVMIHAFFYVDSLWNVESSSNYHKESCHAAKSLFETENNL